MKKGGVEQKLKLVKPIDVLKDSLKLSAIFLTIIIMILGLFYYSQYQSNKELLESEEEQIVKAQKELLSSSISLVLSDISFIADLKSIHIDLEKPSIYNDFAGNLLSFSERQRIYDQIRYIDQSGQEIVRINFNQGKPSIVPKEELQNKKDRYYFKETMELGHEEIFVSPFDLNVENGAIERPTQVPSEDIDSTFNHIWSLSKDGLYAKPIIRISKPVFFGDENTGIVIANLFGTHMFRVFDQVSTHPEAKAYIVNHDGFWIKGPTPEVEFGFMEQLKPIEKGHFANYFPSAWDIVDNSTEGNLNLKEGLITFTEVKPSRYESMSDMGNLDENHIPHEGGGEEEIHYAEDHWHIVSFIPKEKVSNIIMPNLEIYLVLFLSFSLLSIVVSFLISKTKLEIEEAQKVVREKSKILQRANTRINRYSQKLKKSNKLKEMFVDILRHDILNPVGVIKMYSELLKGTGKEKKYIKTIKRASTKAENIANKAQQYAKVEDATKIDKQKLYLKDIIAKVCRDVRPSYRKENVKLINKVKDKMPIIANPLISEIFLNFLTNALKYGKDGKKVEITTINHKEHYDIRITDYGEGIEKKFQKGIFTRLERAGAREGVVGTGLGLAIAKKIAELHGGQVWVEDNPKGGAIFVTKLPKA